jgi:hypothetical protein
MAMNLRENKMDQFKESKEKKGFFNFGNSQKKLPKGKAAVSIKAPVPQIVLEPVNTSQKIKWIKKEKSDVLPQKNVDYQEHYNYEKEYSRYIKENPENVIVTWRGPEFEHYPHDRQWYMIALFLCL